MRNEKILNKILADIKTANSQKGRVHAISEDEDSGEILYILRKHLLEVVDIESVEEEYNISNIDNEDFLSDFFGSDGHDAIRDAEQKFNGIRLDTLIIKDMEYNDNLVGYVLTLSDDRIIQIQFDDKYNIYGSIDDSWLVIDRTNDYGLNLTSEEEEEIENFINNNQEILNKAKELTNNKLIT